MVKAHHRHASSPSAHYPATPFYKATNKMAVQLGGRHVSWLKALRETMYSLFNPFHTDDICFHHMMLFSEFL